MEKSEVKVGMLVYHIIDEAYGYIAGEVDGNKVKIDYGIKALGNVDVLIKHLVVPNGSVIKKTSKVTIKNVKENKAMKIS